VKLQTQIPFTPAENQIDFSSKILLLGSCFSENIGSKLDFFQFQNWQNPFGIIYNPISLVQLIERALENRVFTKDDIFQQDEIWYTWEAHSSCSSIEPEALIILLNNRLELLKEAISQSSHVIITLGSSWVYQLNSENIIVANCHKVPQGYFTKELLSVSQIEKSLLKMVEMIQFKNPNASVVFTVSPVRHLKDGFIENSQSKAHLITAIQKTIEKSSVYYFPSYEIVMDELRDYRYYASDLVHPNDLAIEYIWEKFKLVWISPKTESLQKEIATIRKGLLHKPFQPESLKHQKFVATLQEKMKKLNKQYSHFIWD